MFDVSYAAAWELGRLLALQSKSASVSLFNWKRAHAQKLKDAEQQLTHLPFESPAADLALPSTVSAWFKQLALLKGVPFYYLVPDEQMLPQESIRFFWMDALWQKCLLDGAFSIGRVTAADHGQDTEHQEKLAAIAPKTVTGFLLRSDVVAGWPSLQVDGYDKAAPDDQQSKLPVLRMDRVSKNVLICLFAGIVQTVDIHQRPEALHFGLDRPPEAGSPALYKKELRNDDGTPGDQSITVEVPWRERERRVVNITCLAQKGNIDDAAHFAVSMIEGVEKVRFIMMPGRSAGETGG
jgi:hypothetical protein